MMNEISSCPIYYNSYDQADHSPRMLINCGHTICSSCLTQILQGSSVFKGCPLDKTAFKSNQTTLQAFPINYLVKQILEVVGEFEPCPIHQKKLELLCLTDKCKVCSDCAIFGDHQGHKLRPLSDVKKKRDEERRKLEEVLAQYEKSRGSIREILLDEKESLNRLIRTQFDGIRRLLYSKEFEVMNHVEGIFRREVERLDETIGEDSDLVKGLKRKVQEKGDDSNSNSFCEMVDEDSSDGANRLDSVRLDEKVKEMKMRLRKMSTTMSQELQAYKQKIEKIDAVVPSYPEAGEDLVPLKEFLPSRGEAKMNTTYISNVKKVQLPFSVKLEEGKLEAVISRKATRATIALMNLDDVNQINFRVQRNSLNYYEKIALHYLWQSFKNISNASISYEIEEDRYTISDCTSAIIQNHESIHSFSAAFDRFKLTDFQLIAFIKASASQMTNLASLSLILDSTQISNEALQYLAQDTLPSMKDLESLQIDLYKVLVTDEGILPVLKTCTTLKSLRLHLQETRVTDQGFLRLVNNITTQMNNLKSLALFLSYLPISDEGIIKLLEGIKDVEQLTLELRCTKVTDVSMKYLLEKFVSRQKRLKGIRIVAEATDVSLEVLKELEDLNSLFSVNSTI